MLDLQVQIEFIQQQQQLQLQKELARENAKIEVTPSGEFREMLPDHFQWERIKDEDRKRLLRGYPKIKDLEPITDHNGLACRNLPAEKKKQVTKDLVQIQRENIDIIRVACRCWQQLDGTSSLESLRHVAKQALRDITTLAVDNASRAAESQLNICMEHADAKGALNLLVRADLDIKDKSIFQQSHVDAIKDFKDFSRQVDSAVKKKSEPKDSKQKFQQSRGSGFRPRTSSFRGNGGFRGRGGRGRGTFDRKRQRDSAQPPKNGKE